MSLHFKGILPIGGIYPVISGSLPALNAEISFLYDELAKLTASLDGSIEMSLNLPNITSLGLMFGIGISDLPTTFDPTKLVSASFDFQFDIGIELGLISIVLELCLEIYAGIELGLGLGGLASWAYSGKSKDYGNSVIQSLRYGVSGFLPQDQVSGILVASGSESGWKTLSKLFNTGDKPENIDPKSVDPKLKFNGSLSGGELLLEVNIIGEKLKVFLALLKNLKINLELSLQLCLGLNLPPIPTIDPNFDLSLALDNLINVKIDLIAEIGFLLAKINLLLEFVVNLMIDLSAEGIGLWSYSGSVDMLGSAIANEFQDGIREGNGKEEKIYSSFILCKSPKIMAGFSLMFGGI